MERKVKDKAEFKAIVTEEVNKLHKIKLLREEREKLEKELKVLKEDVDSLSVMGIKSETDKFETIYMNYLNGNSQDVTEDIKGLTIGELMRFLDYWNKANID